MRLNEFEIFGDATVQVVSTSSIGISAGYQGLLGAGFEMTGTSSSNWYARKMIDDYFRYSI